MRLTRTAVLAVLTVLPAAIASDSVLADRSVALKPKSRDVVAGFRMEGAAHISVVFGDAKAFRGHVDRFLDLEREMTRARHDYGLGSRGALAELALARARRCPVAKVAPYYLQARRAAETFEKLGSELAARYHAIRELHEIGDTASLTPDYRWKINRTRGIYRGALRDLHEMRAHIRIELDRTARHRGCKAVELRRVGAKMPVPVSQRPINPLPKARKRHAKQAAPPEAATPVSFYVDNTRCAAPVGVFVDGQQLGTVQGHGRGAFRSPAGRHSMCLISSDQNTSCGQQGTVRHAFIYDSWSISLHCLK